jgi:hypothetical protein
MSTIQNKNSNKRNSQMTEQQLMKKKKCHPSSTQTELSEHEQVPKIESFESKTEEALWVWFLENNRITGWKKLRQKH